ncbi:glutaredoxin 2 [Siccibacter turicensis]|uniref:glutaredoxin 2 n=1 Tax=Siccibacter turicensis TaxID=357233 RepID=UPI002A6A6C1D|nr:glutaredoxin 2 [Siccibacter turicensis]MDY0971408.1 glutaredoxin 2 [Siccibacter turicensis]
MKIYIYEHCPFCVRARMIFGIKKFPVELCVMSEADAQTPTRMVGKKIAPILEKEDGTFMAESMDIVHYVDELDDERILKSTGNAEIARWCETVTPTLFRLVIPRFTRAEFAEIRTPASREAYIQRERRAFGDLDKLILQTPGLLQDMNAWLVELEPLLADRKEVNESDFRLYPLLRSLTIVRDIQFGPDTRIYIDFMSALTGVNNLFDQAQ